MVALKLLDKSPSDRHLTTLPPSSRHHHQHALFNSYSKPKVIHTNKHTRPSEFHHVLNARFGSLEHRHHQSRNSPLGFGQAPTNPRRLSFTGPKTIASPLNCSGLSCHRFSRFVEVRLGMRNRPCSFVRLFVPFVVVELCGKVRGSILV